MWHIPRSNYSFVFINCLRFLKCFYFQAPCSTVHFQQIELTDVWVLHCYIYCSFCYLVLMLLLLLALSYYHCIFIIYVIFIIISLLSLLLVVLLSLLVLVVVILLFVTDMQQQHYYHASYPTDDWHLAYMFLLVYFSFEVCLEGVFPHSVRTSRDPCGRVFAPPPPPPPLHEKTKSNRGDQLHQARVHLKCEMTHRSACIIGW